MSTSCHSSSCQSVIVLGYGKIGRLKAGLWQKMGYKVYAYDLINSRGSVAFKDGVTFVTSMVKIPHDLNVIDICTSSGEHIPALRGLLPHLCTKPDIVIIEKPFVSDVGELGMLETLLKDTRFKWLEKILYVNEHYYSSATVRKLREMIGDEDIESVIIDISKNRLKDTCNNNRFFDYKLGVFGIEVPHELAILNLLGLNTSDMTITSNDRFVADSEIVNQGTIVRANINNTEITLRSFIGDFDVVDGSITHRDPCYVVRITRVKTNKAWYNVVLDPHPDLERLYGCVEFEPIDGSTQNKREVIYDNQLLEHMKALCDKGDNECKYACSLEEAVKQSKLLFNMSEKSVCNYLESDEPAENIGENYVNIYQQ